jgi:DNA sulfur modification protein DndC
MFFKASLPQLYREDERPWRVGFSGGKDSTLLASLIFDAVLSIPAKQVRRPVYCVLSGVFAPLSTVYRMPSTVFRIPAIAKMHFAPNGQVFPAERVQYRSEACRAAP